MFVGDVVGGLGRRTLLGLLPGLVERHRPTFVVVNGENVAGGLGITPKLADEIFEAGVDAITLGNHAFHRREIGPYLDSGRPIIRPANYLNTQPGRGAVVVEKDGVRLGVVNLSGNVFLRAGRVAFLDLDGRVTAVVGTHTHVPTADARVLPGGTAYITDVGMTGPRGGVIGVKKEQAIDSLRTHMQVRFETSEDDPWLNAVLVTTDGPMRATAIEQLLLPWRSAPPPAAGP
jgi:2',3'-cyclic-nucleotide 2'-phosphodiesterase